MKKNNQCHVYFVIFILLLHFCFINGLEKMLFHSYVDSPQVRRPNNECETIHNPAVECLGMPSGHVEITTLLGCFLYSSNILSFPILIGVIVAMALQRILTHRHTVLQTIVGFLFGLFYAFAYLSIQVSYQQVLLCVFFIFFYCNLLVLYVNRRMTEKIPDWVDKTMFPNIEKKKIAPYFYRLTNMFIPSFYQSLILFISWKDVEFYLDKIVDNIKQTGIHFDGVVGIKTGGAIISDYISNQLHLPNYKIKISRKKYNCNKGIKNTYEDTMDKYITYTANDYMVCEGISDNLSGKKLILIDEIVSSGVTMNASIDYLISKQVDMVYPTAIKVSPNSKSHPSVQLHALVQSSDNGMIWPWGYDN